MHLTVIEHRQVELLPELHFGRLLHLVIIDRIFMMASHASFIVFLFVSADTISGGTSLQRVSSAIISSS
jgi:hypothetical protein